MERRKNGQVVVIIALVIAIVCMSVGFAAFSSELKITGTAKVAASKWDVHFVTTSYAEKTNSVVATSKDIQNLVATYAVTLTKPGDFYSFDIDVINDGTFDATLKTLTLTELTDAQKKYLTYEVTYGSTVYTSSQTGLAIDLAASATTKVNVKVSYIMPESSDDLPADDVNLTLTAALGYEQKA